MYHVAKNKICYLYIRMQYFRGFTVVMETSRLIRVCPRKYIIRIAAVSQEHVLVCNTRKDARPGNNVVLVLASKLNSLCGWSK